MKISNTHLKKKSSRSKPDGSAILIKNLPVLFAGIVLLSLTLIQEENFRWLGSPWTWGYPYWNCVFILALALVAYGFYRLPSHLSSNDISPKIAYPILVLILGITAYLRFIRADQAYSGYWADPAIEISDVCEMVQKHIFHVIFPEGGREPFFSYVAGIIWWLFPSLKALFVQRLTANIINLVTFWLFYRLGRELSGKRLVGLIFAALGAASKGLLLLNISGMRITTLCFGIALMLLLQVKLFKKFTLPHFLWWGVALAVGLYTYTVIRVWVPFLVILTLFSIFWNKRNETIPLWIRGGIFAFLIFYLSFYLSNLLGIFYQNAISKIWDPSLPIWILWQVICGIFFIYGYRISHVKGKQLCAWGLGLLLLSVLSQPIASHFEATGRITDESALPKTFGGLFSLDYLKTFYHVHVEQTFLALFTRGGGRSDMNVLGDCFFDFQATVLIVTGLVYAVVKPTKWTTFLILSTLVSLVPYCFTSDMHMGKIAGVAVPLLLLAALALNFFIEKFFYKSSKLKGWGVLLILLVAIFWAWEVQSSYRRVFDTWWWQVWNDDVCVGRVVDAALPNNRVYLTPIPASIQHSGQFFDANTQAVLHDDQSIYLMNPSGNVIDLRPDEARKNVVVIISPLVTQLVKRIKNDFPKSIWTPYWQYYQTSHLETPFLYSVLIPAEQIPDKPGKLFSYQVSNQTDWRRQVYLSRLGFREGIIEDEDLSPTLEPTPPGADSHPVAAEKIWNAPENGNYSFVIESHDYTQVSVDGRRILFLESGSTGIAKNHLFLKKGNHRIRISTYLILDRNFPILSVEDPSLHYQSYLGSS